MLPEKKEIIERFDQLTERQKRIVVLSVVEEMTVKEISLILEIREIVVKILLVSALSWLTPTNKNKQCNEVTKKTKKINIKRR